MTGFPSEELFSIEGPGRQSRWSDPPSLVMNLLDQFVRYFDGSLASFVHDRLLFRNHTEQIAQSRLLLHFDLRALEKILISDQVLADKPIVRGKLADQFAIVVIGPDRLDYGLCYFVCCIDITVVGEVHVFQEDKFFVAEYLHQCAQNTVLGVLQILNVPFVEIWVVLL
jgi:hypothetical protein